ncbi:Protein of unknown function (DUF2422) domain containing protein [Amanita muscaria]
MHSPSRTGTGSPTHHNLKSVRINSEGLQSRGPSDSGSNPASPSLQWIPANFTWPKLKPLIRCSVAAWASAMLFLIPSVLRLMGQAGFVILVVAFMSPPAEPFIVVLERELLILGFSSLAWAWCCLGIFFAYLARENKNFKVSLLSVIDGQFLETTPTIILSIFIFLGTVFFLYIRARQGPGPYLFSSVLACLTIDTVLTTAVLFPFPYYQIGKSLLIPISFHSAISLLCATFIFPESVTSQYIGRVQAIISPLASALEMHRTILRTPHDSQEFKSLSSTINATIGKAEDALVPLAASARLLKSDLVYSRFAPSDFRPFSDCLGRLIGRATGMCMYFALIDATRDRFSITPAPSLPSSPIISSTPSRQPSPERHHDKDETHTAAGSYEPSILHTPLTRRLSHQPSHHHHREGHGHSSHARTHTHSHSHVHRTHLHHVHHKLLHLKRSSRHEHIVGMFEAQKYLNLEATRLHTPYAELYARQMLDLLHESCDGLLEACRESLLEIQTWLGKALNGRFKFWATGASSKVEQEKRLNELRQVRDRLSVELELFRTENRHRVLLPYEPAFEPKLEDGENEHDIPPHRYLFQCYVYQFHLMQFLDSTINLEQRRQRETLWTPVQHIFRWNNRTISEHHEKDEEDNPDVIHGIEIDEAMIPERRDPDALPPGNTFELIASYMFYAIASLFAGNVLYAIKAGVFTVVLCIPSFVESSAGFAYKNRFVWAIFIGQLSLARFRGDTAFAFISRVISTFCGCVIGMVMCNSNGNVYGLGAVLVIFLPIFFYARLYWPIVPLTNIITWVTTVLVVGYSWLNVQIPVPNATGVGFEVAWKRFVLVVIGVTAAYVASFLPPSTTIRHYHRKLVSTTCSELGSIYCHIISFANSRRQEEVPEIVTDLLAVRRKLRKAQAMRQNVRYEFSLRGKWPARRYLLILDIQLQLAFALSHLMSIVEQLEPAWSKAFLRRTRFNDTDFQGDILAVITMISTALRTAHPLPQVTPCPLLDRFMLRFHGLEVIHKEFQDDYGLPRQLTLDTLKNEQYMIFCVGVTTAFSIMTRLDRLMLAAKEVVGEQYYIYGLVHGNHGGVEMGPRTESIQLRAPGIV